MTDRASVAARVAGIVVALGYLLGVVDGPVLGAVGGLALTTFGRGLVAPARAYLLGVAAFAVLAAASGVVALRWATLGLADVRGIHAVLGPSFLVEPVAAAVACGAAIVAGLLGVAIWLGGPAGVARGNVVWAAEAFVAGLFLTTLAVGRDVAGAIDLAWWFGGVLVALAAAVGGSRLLAASGSRLPVGLLGFATLLVVAGAAVVGLGV